MRPDLLLDARRDLGFRLTQEPFQETFYKSSAFDWDDTGKREAERTKQWPQVLRTTQLAVAQAEVYRVTPEMTHVIEAMAASMPGIEQIQRREEVASPCGLVFFERPLPVIDVRGERQLLHWLLWAPITIGEHNDAGWMLAGFNDISIEPDQVMTRLFARNGYFDAAEYRGRMGRWSPMGVEFVVVSQRVGPAVVQAPSYTDPYADDPDVPPVIGSGTNHVRYVVALWTLLTQDVTDLTQEHPRKRRRRTGIMPIPTPERVTVVRLRHRNPGHHEGPSPVLWSHRWLVRGHPRQQRYGPGRSQVRTIWIQPFVKGPADKPFVVTKKIYSLER